MISAPEHQRCSDCQHNSGEDGVDHPCQASGPVADRLDEYVSDRTGLQGDAKQNRRSLSGRYTARKKQQQKRSGERSAAAR